MIDFGLILFVFIFLIISDLMSKYVFMPELDILNIFYVLFPIILFIFIAFIGEFVYCIGKDILYNKTVEYVGFLFENIFFILMITTIIIFLFNVYLNIRTIIIFIITYFLNKK